MNAYIKKMSMAVLVVVLVVLFLPMQVLAAATGTHEPVSGITVDVNGATDNSMTSGAITVTAKGSAGFLGMGSSSKTATITVTNSGSSTATVSFNWTATSVNQLTIDGTIYSGASGSFSKVMNAGASFTITVTTAKDSTTNTFVMNSFGWTAAAASSTVTFQYNNALGSIKVAGTAVAAGGSAEIPSSGAEVVATPVSGAAFVGWIDSEHKIISTAATHTLNPASNMTVTAAFASAATDAWFSVDSTYAYNSLHDAANSAGASKVVLMNDGTLFGSHTIPAGVTLLIPFDSSNTLYTTEPGEVEGYSTTNIYRTLTMADGATLTVNGAMSLSNKVCYTSAKINQGSPSGYVSMVRMQGNSAINVYGALYAWGFITGSGSVTAYNGANVYECFQYMDYRGGGQSTESEMDSYDIFPLSQYYVQNIEVPLTLHYGATEYAHAIICAKPLTSYVAACSNVKFVGTSGSMFNLTTGGYITKTYDGSTDRLIVSVNGSATMSSINLVINKTILGDVSINSANYDLPINSNMTINVNSGTTTINQDIALLAGSELNIAAGATVQMGSGYNLFVYDTDQWEEFVYAENYSGTSYNQDGNYHNLRMRPLAYVPGRVSGVDRASQELPDAAIMVNGTLSANTGYIYTTYGPMTYKEGPTVGAEYINHYVTVDSENRGGANIYSTASTGKVILASGTTTEVYQVIQDPWHNGSDTDDDYYIAIPVSTAKLTNSNGELVSFGAGTYVYDSKSGAWYCETHTDVDTDHTCDVCGFTTECVDEVPEGETYADHKCDICGETISECADENSDSICDICGASLCAHDWVDADCDTPKTCSKCETTEGEPLGHTPGADATCTTNQVCTREGCGVELAAALGHNMVTDEAVGATCTETGLTAGEHCSRCDDATTAQEVVPALGHGYAAVVTAPTCTEQGYTTHTCATCGDSYKDTYVDALDHTWDDGTVTTIPTCSATGVKTFNCTVDGCNGIKTETVDKDPNNHKLVTDAAVAATCTKTGLTEGKHCEYCGTVTVTQTEVPALGHTEVVDAAFAPTCTETGLTQGSHCSVCNKVLVAQTEVAAKGHAYGDGVVTTAPTCTATGVRTFTCGTCSDSYTKTEAATGHTEVTVDAVAPTCEATGLTAGTKCQTCGATITAQQTVAALGHDFANYTSNNDATCISDGTKTATCTRCDATDTVADVDSMLGHDFQSYTSDNNATCAADGTKTAKCEREGCEATDTIADDGSKTDVHKWGEYVSNGDATCTKDGTETATCTVCKTATDTRTDEGSKLDHTYSSVVTAPTCTASGYTTHTCSKCGDTYTSDEVAALGHTEVAQEAVAATCTESGLTAGEYCSVCNEVLVAQEVVPKKGHSYSGAVTEPTCTEDGYTTYACSGCGDSYVDDHTEATGHSYNEVVTAPTCTEAGYTTYTCSACGDSYVADEVAAKGHDYNAVVTAPTCTAEGFTTYTCACGDSYVADKEPATGHSYGEWVQTTAPTCTEDGEKTRTCACGEKETETVSALGHTNGDPVVENNVDATCGNAGSYDTVVHCVVCEVEVSRVTTTVDALGHSYSSNVTTEPTCTEAGVKTFTCGTCGDTYTEVVAAQGHDEVSHEAKAPTCIDIGWDSYVTCNRCDYTTKVELPVIAHSDSAEDTDHICDTEGCGEVMNVCSDAENDGDHTCDICDAEAVSEHTDAEAVVENKVSATCGSAGSYDSVVYCAECGAERSRETITENATSNHHYSSTVTTPATCVDAGVRTYTCSGCRYSYTEEIPATDDHAWIDATYTVPKTCSECGKTEGEPLVDVENPENIPAEDIEVALDAMVKVTDTIQPENSGMEAEENKDKLEETTTAAGGTSYGTSLVITLNAVVVDKDGDALVATKITYDVSPMLHILNEAGVQIGEQKITSFESDITFRLPVDKNTTAGFTHVWHKETEDLGLHKIQTDANGNKFVEVKSKEFSEFTVEVVVECETHTGGTATCQQQAICTTCGTAYGDLAEHSYDKGNYGVCDCGAMQLYLTAIDVSFDAELLLRTYYNIPDTLLNDNNAYAEVTKKGTYGDEVTKIYMAEFREAGPTSYGDYMVEEGIAAPEMGRDVIVRFVDGTGNVISIKDYVDGSVNNEVVRKAMDYATRVFEVGTQKQKNLVQAMLVYGGYAQKWFNTDADNPVYDVLKEYGYSMPDFETISADSINQELTITGNNNIGIAYTAQEAHFDSAVYHGVFFALENGYSINDFKFELTWIDVYKNEYTTVVEEIGYDSQYNEYYIEIPDIASPYLDYMYNIKITNLNTNETYNVSTSIMVWAKMVMQKSSNVAQINLAKAVYYYNQAANTFFNK